MLAAKRLAGVKPEVNLRECITHPPPSSVIKVAHSGFETQRTGVIRSPKTVVSVPPEKGLVSSKIYKRKHLDILLSADQEKHMRETHYNLHAISIGCVVQWVKHLIKDPEVDDSILTRVKF